MVLSVHVKTLPNHNASAAPGGGRASTATTGTASTGTAPATATIRLLSSFWKSVTRKFSNYTSFDHPCIQFDISPCLTIPNDLIHRMASMALFPSFFLCFLKSLDFGGYPACSPSPHSEPKSCDCSIYLQAQGRLTEGKRARRCF